MENILTAEAIREILGAEVDVQSPEDRVFLIRKGTSTLATIRQASKSTRLHGGDWSGFVAGIIRDALNPGLSEDNFTYNRRNVKISASGAVMVDQRGVR